MLALQSTADAGWLMYLGVFRTRVSVRARARHFFFSLLPWGYFFWRFPEVALSDYQEVLSECSIVYGFIGLGIGMGIGIGIGRPVPRVQRMVSKSCEVHRTHSICISHQMHVV